MTFVSVSPVLAMNFTRSSILLQESGSSDDTLRETAISPRSGACSSWAVVRVFDVDCETDEVVDTCHLHPLC
jgi:hypothetical protein